jgi:hypothetical protein
MRSCAQGRENRRFESGPMGDSRRLPLTLALALMCVGYACADGRPGRVEFSDGRKETGAISLSPGKDLRLFTTDKALTFQLAEVKEIHFKPEKEEMAEGFYFPTAGQATQAKTGEVYPTRYLQAKITLADGKVQQGHLYTTTFYVETEDNTDKVVVLAKQTGANGQKLGDLVYPTSILFDATATASASAMLDLSQAGFVPTKPPMIVVEPELTQPAAQAVNGKQAWSISTDRPDQLFFAVEAADGIHVPWAQGASPAPANLNAADNSSLGDVDPLIRGAVKNALHDMQDFYDTRTLLGSFAGGDGTDIYSLVMMSRNGAIVGMTADTKPWSLVLFHFKYDPDEKKMTVLHKAVLSTGRATGNSPPPTVFKQPELYRALSPGNQP